MAKKMDTQFDHGSVEGEIYKRWEEGGYFEPEIDKDKEPFTIVLPPPNASGKMHTGNVLMLAIEDVLVRWHRMMGDPTLWVPGTDHAGFETQITFERELEKEGKSRLDYGRDELYNKIYEFVEENRESIEEQIREMGASVDWSRYRFMLDDEVIETVYETFKRMSEEGLVYRDDYLVNYCPTCGTTFADLEVEYKRRKDPLYFVKYALDDESGEFLTVATVRPETIMVDTHLAVSPKDKEKSSLVGKFVRNPLTGKRMEVVEDRAVDPEFGTGVVKLTPAHDPNDWEAGKRHDLPVVNVLDMDGNLNENAGEWEGLGVKEARKKIVEKLENEGFLEKVEKDYEHNVAVCYKGSHDIEPLVIPNWFVKVESLKGPAMEVVEKGEVEIYPKWREKTYMNWMKEMRDWPISRQVVWGIRIPAWYDVDENLDLRVSFLNSEGEMVNGEIGKLLKEHDLEEIKESLQGLTAPKGAEAVISGESPGKRYLQETDTFDTWFSSGHWPLTTLGYPSGEDFEYFYPTSVMETGWEIIRFWVSRMIMLGLYLTGEVPFRKVYLHGLVRALDGKKMSKSLGNVIDPEEYADEYGVDALRMGLISGTATGKDFNFPEDKVIAYRNFSNKLWNMVRFMKIMFDKTEKEIPLYEDGLEVKLKKEDKKILKKLDGAVKEVNSDLERFRFAQAGEKIYHFMWDDVASVYIEKVKDREDKELALSVLRYVIKEGVKLLHPFMPYVTEALWEHIPGERESEMLIVAPYP